MNWLIFVMVIVYFVAALITIINLVLVIVPRIRQEKTSNGGKLLNPTFFAGISKFASPEEYAQYLKKTSGDEDEVYQLFASQIFSLGNINKYKNDALKRTTSQKVHHPI